MSDLDKIIIALRRAIEHGTIPELAGFLAELEKIKSHKTITSADRGEPL